MLKEKATRAVSLCLIFGILASTPLQTSNAQTLTEKEMDAFEAIREVNTKEDKIDECYVSITELTQTSTTATNLAWDTSQITLEDLGIKDTYVSEEYIEYAREIVNKHFPEIPLSLVIAIIEFESGGRAGAVNKLGCKGLMQVYEKLHKARMKEWGVTNLLDPYSNILIGCDILKDCIKYWNGDMHGALMRYNGSSNVKKKLETQNYSSYSIKVLKRAEELSLKYY